MAYQVYIDNDSISIKTTSDLKTKRDIAVALSTIRANNEDIPLQDYRVKRLSDGKIFKKVWKN
jgi:uncharacterized protein YpmS